MIRVRQNLKTAAAVPIHVDTVRRAPASELQGRIAGAPKDEVCSDTSRRFIKGTAQKKLRMAKASSCPCGASLGAKSSTAKSSSRASQASPCP